MFGLNPYLAGGALLILVGSLSFAGCEHLRAKSAVASEAKVKAEKRQIQADYDALKAAQEHERKISKAATDDYENRLKALAVARTDIPTRVVQLCRSPTGYVPAPAPAAARTDPGTAREQPAETGSDIEAGPDIGPALYQLADQADERAAQCNSLIRWVRSR